VQNESQLNHAIVLLCTGVLSMTGGH
jgi:hypothetical protein